MNIPPARRAGAAVILVLALGACGSSSKPGASGCATTSADAKAVAALVQKGLQAAVAGNTTDAEKHFKEVLCSDQNNKYAHYNLGLIFQQRNENSDAEAEYNKVLAVDANYGPALYNLAILRTAANDAPGAIDLYRREIAANPKDANAHFNLGLLLRDAGKTTEANAEIKAAVNLDSALQAKATNEGYPFTAK